MRTWMRLGPFVVGILLITIAAGPGPRQTGDNPNPPEQPVKLIFIHHSTGENWLTDDYGNLGRTLDRNNYFVSDTNYGWGPNAIGDRTDIPNWTEWFASEDTPDYMDALFDENGQHSSYTRTIFDPGGENTIVMFKSCFPNSALEGSPNDAPNPEGELTVGHAKYVYNEILKYFATRPDKLFIVITQPPLSDSTYAANARAFTQWLSNDWLRENNYSLKNVAVFDFYNILTGPDAHHRYNNGQVEYVPGNRNTLYYPSGDDHPSVQGSQKATDEFVPLLNVFYHRWKQNAPSQPTPVATTASQVESQPGASSGFTWIDDFDSNRLPASAWEGFRDEATSTTLTCEVQAGTGRTGNALHFDFDIATNSWGTCATSFETAQRWSAGDMLRFSVHTNPGVMSFDVDLYTGSSDQRATYVISIEVPAESAGWATMGISLDAFRRASWEENAGGALTPSDKIVGMAFGATMPQDAPNAGELWVDDLQIVPGVVEQPEEVSTTAPAESQPTEANQSQSQRKPSLPCTSGIVLPLFFLGLIRLNSRKR